MSKWSSYPKAQLITENWRKFINEQDEPEAPVQPNGEVPQAQAEAPQSNSFCDNFPDACKDVLGTVRANMPQIPDAAAFEKELASPPGAGLETNEPEQIPDLGKATRQYLDSSDDAGEWPRGDQVSVETVENINPAQLKPTQKDIYMDNATKKAKAGADPKIDWAPWNAAVLVSKDGYLLDGHHRWAATIIYNQQNPEDAKKMSIEKVGVPIEQLLKIANAYTDAIGGTRHAGGATSK